ncbi:MAG: flagellar export protein FliJ [Sterolibacterium sp.]|nr:flagellar export protein FliJ [Sterolibacterium sp.]
MSHAFPLQTLLDLSQLRMDDAAKRLGQLLASEQEASARLLLLQQYRAEYQGRFISSSQQGIGRDQLDNYRSFLLRLDEAIDQARQMTEHSRQRTSLGQQDWLDKRGQVKAYDTLSQRHQSHQSSLENRKEQKLLDEHAARRFLSAEKDSS